VVGTRNPHLDHDFVPLVGRQSVRRIVLSNSHPLRKRRITCGFDGRKELGLLVLDFSVRYKTGKFPDGVTGGGHLRASTEKKEEV